MCADAYASLSLCATRLTPHWLQFDKKLKGEKKTRRAVGPKAKRLPAEVMDSGRSRDLKVLRHVLGGAGEGEDAAEGGVVVGAGSDAARRPTKGKKRRGVHAKQGGKGGKGKGGKGKGKGGKGK